MCARLSIFTSSQTTLHEAAVDKFFLLIVDVRLKAWIGFLHFRRFDH